MSHRWLLSLMCLAVLFVFVTQLTGARGELRVNETGSSVSFQKDPAEVLLAIENPSSGVVNTNVEVELLDPFNNSIAKTTQVQAIGRGSQTLKLSLPFSFSNANQRERNQILWYRLRYRLSPQESPAEILAGGLISLSEITPDIFELRITATEIVREGDRYRVRVQAVHPATHRPAANVRIDAKVTLDGDKDSVVKLNDSRMSDANGRVLFDFKLPSRYPQFPHGAQRSGGELEVTGTRGAVVVQNSSDVLVDQYVRVLISTDKPLYQPGQVIHMRGLLVSPSNQALPNSDAYFKVCDPEGAVLYRTVATTSRFGIASADWNVPENARLGNYRIFVGVDGGEDQETQDVRISRYELPNFKVNVDLDRKFYLPGQEATVTVRAEYLFGQPLLRGKVRVVRESEREWNYREQKWESSDEDEHTGETNADGSFVAKLDLEEGFEDLTDSSYYRSRDFTYAAYFTDPTTNRTEQRRFDVRITKDPIHVYVVESYNSNYNHELPVMFYVSTYYADGTPARCKVNVAFTDENEDKEKTKRVATVRTNRYGLARVNTQLPNELEEEEEIRVLLSATDSRGGKGSASDTFRFDDDDEAAVRVDTDKAIYRPGEAINAVITTNTAEEAMVVDLAGQAGLIRSERVQLHDGRASISLPFRPEFKNYLSIVAYPESATSRSVLGTRTVLYPHNSELNVDVRSSQDTYRPGEDVQLNFKVRSADARSEESALGVAVLDQAVLERFRTDQEFGGGEGGFENAMVGFLGLADQLAGVSLRDLQQLDTSRPISPDLDLLAAVLMRNISNHVPGFHSSDEFEEDAATVFGASMREQLKALKTSLNNDYARTMKYPATEAALRNSLSQAKIDFDSVRDPWGMRYHPEFYINGENEGLTLSSSGPDKRYNTPDDFVVEYMSWRYFRPLGEAIDRAVKRYHHRTGKFIRDAASLRAEVSADGINLDQLLDRWGKPYRLDFKVEESYFVLHLRSGGPDKQFSKYDWYPRDDFIIWRSTIDYFEGPRKQINAALTENLNQTKKFPLSEAELRQALQGLGDFFENLRDPWGHPYYGSFRTQSVYTNRVRVENRSTFGDTTSAQTQVKPVTQKIAYVVLRSMGPDGKMSTSDDFSVGTFSGVISEQPPDTSTRIVPISAVVFSGANGAIVGVVSDPTGAVIVGVTVKATRQPSGTTYEATTNDNGRYGFPSLPPGFYELTFEVPSFMRGVMTQVLVRANNITEANMSLQVASVAETVTITGEGSPVETQVSSTIGNKIRERAPTKRNNVATSQEISTPRLREYFPETLLWQPSIETDKQGRAQINFKLADNITTWNVAVIGSTEDGRIGVTEKKIKAFQPFFVEHDPPRVLTEGDEISLPVVVRNYLSRAQKVDLEIKPEGWFSLLGPAQKQTSVVAGDAKRETFDFRVVASVKDGKQRITARGSDEQDAIEKPVRVHPDGEELSVTAGDILNDITSLELEIAPNIVSNSGRGELKFYPNLLAHVVEGVEAIMQRPYGCGEQTISSTYPSLLLLRHYKKSGESFPLGARAQRYLSDGYSRLLNYRTEDGGFTYWGYGDPDLALTAFALRFLDDARDVTAVDQEVINKTREWLVKQQRPDGSWRVVGWSDREARDPIVVLTAYITRILARIDAQASEPVKRALEFLGRESQRTDEPYLLASYALAATHAKDTERAKVALEKLRTLAREEGNTTYWSLETNTPFYGWGLTGRVETTAVVVQALAQNCSLQAAACEGDKKLINRGLLFLLKQKDRYGAWHSTQATVNVLDAMLLLFSIGSPGNADAQSLTEIAVNGNSLQSLQINARFSNPVTVDISQFLRSGKNRIEIKRPAGSPFASVQAVANYYVPWSEPKSATPIANTNLRLQVKFDKTDAKINDEITCRVEAERVGFRGYGMMLAEIGIPPGAEVDRSSLEVAVKESNIDQYDVLPDRVVVYLWPTAGGVSFNFKFRPRFGLNAKTAPSTLYDYYNPEATVVVAPSLFRVR